MRTTRTISPIVRPERNREAAQSKGACATAVPTPFDFAQHERELRIA
jgi:hypothetical protein